MLRHPDPATSAGQQGMDMHDTYYVIANRDSIYLIAFCTILFAYLLGSIPFGLILTKMTGLGDIRNLGSGNIGATNVLRTGNKKIAAAVLLLDGLKGYVAVYVVYEIVYKWLLPDDFFGFDDSYSQELYIMGNVLPFMLLAGLSAVLGHIFPVWLRFKGGKGVATAIGAYFGIMWPLGVFVVLVWIVVFGLFRISSLAALCSFFALTIWIIFLTAARPFPVDYYLIYAFIITALIFWRHKDNIKRLLNRTEPKFGKQQ